MIIGSGKDGLPIILGNVDAPHRRRETAPCPRKRASPPKEKTSAEKTPSDTLTKPAEKTPYTQPPEAQHFSYPFPLTLSDIEAIFSRLMGGSPSTPAATGQSDSSKRPAAQPPH